jgi:hypothetical protein
MHYCIFGAQGISTESPADDNQVVVKGIIRLTDDPPDETVLGHVKAVLPLVSI